MAITAQTPLEISLGNALAGAVALGLLILGGAAFIMSQVKDDVSATRSDVAELRQAARDDNRVRADGDAALRQSLADLTSQLQLTTAKLSDVSDSLTKLNSSIRTIDDKLSASIVHQQDFEKSIVARLDSSAFNSQQIPAEWSKAQAMIVTNIKAGGDPLTAWFDGLPGSEK